MVRPWPDQPDRRRRLCTCTDPLLVMVSWLTSICYCNGFASSVYTYPKTSQQDSTWFRASHKILLYLVQLLHQIINLYYSSTLTNRIARIQLCNVGQSMHVCCHMVQEPPEWLKAMHGKTCNSKGCIAEVPTNALDFLSSKGLLLLKCVPLWYSTHMRCISYSITLQSEPSRKYILGSYNSILL